MKKYSLLSLEKALICTLAIVSLLITIVSQTSSINLLLTKGNENSGDQYLISKIQDYKITNVKRFPQKINTPIQEADIIIMGDSFSHVNLGYKNLADSIRVKTKLKVHIYNLNGSGELWTITNPTEYLKKTNYRRTNERRILILQSVDRNTAVRYMNIDTNKNVHSSEEEITFSLYTILAQTQSQIITRTKSLEYFLTENNLTSTFSEKINTIRFHLYKDLPALTPQYSSNPKSLFYSEEIKFENNQLSKSDIKKLSKNIKAISDTLDTKYNLELVFVLMPNKYTAYKGFTNKEGNGGIFYNKIYKNLQDEKVKYIDLYHPLTGSKSFPYWPGDTHLNQVGHQIFIDQVMEGIGQSN